MALKLTTNEMRYYNALLDMLHTSWDNLDTAFTALDTDLQTNCEAIFAFAGEVPDDYYHEDREEQLRHFQDDVQEFCYTLEKLRDGWLALDALKKKYDLTT